MTNSTLSARLVFSYALNIEHNLGHHFGMGFSADRAIFASQSDLGSEFRQHLAMNLAEKRCAHHNRIAVLNEFSLRAVGHGNWLGAAP